MKHPWFFALPFAPLCPFNAFGFPSVSPFWSASNPDWLNEVRCDYPLNSSCFEWSHFGRSPHRNAVGVSPPSNDSASLNRCSRPSRFLANERCVSFYASVQTLGPSAAYSRANWRTTITVRSELFVEQDCCTAFRRTWVSCPLEPPSFQPSCMAILCAALRTDRRSSVQNARTAHVAVAWRWVHSVANSEGTERSRTCFKAEEQ
jgi:hypothetical protein